MTTPTQKLKDHSTELRDEQLSQEELYDIPCMELTSEQLDLLPPRELRWVLTYRAQQRAKIADGSSE